MPLFPAAVLEDLTRRILEAAGTPAPIAESVAAHLVGANLAGHDSHGVLRIPAYLRQIEKGSLLPAEVPEVTRETAATARIDARKGWGQFAAEWAMDLAVHKAGEAGSCSVVLDRCNHIGRLGAYVERAARRAFISSVMHGTGGPGAGAAAAIGGVDRCLGTNPVAFGIPTGTDAPFVTDFATTIVAEGKIQVARNRGGLLPPGCILDREGRPSVSPTDFYDGGSLLFAGGHKGYALNLVTCLLGGLNGAAFGPDSWALSGTVIQALDPRAFLPLEEYQERVRAFLAGIKGGRPAERGGEILYPGEPEQRARVERLARGIEIPDSTWEEIRAGAAPLGVAVPSPNC